MIVNIMRQHWYGAGGFSYKSTWTLQELCPLSILVVNFYQLRKNTIRDKKKRKSETENGNGTEEKGKGIQSTTRTSQQFVLMMGGGVLFTFQ